MSHRNLEASPNAVADPVEYLSDFTALAKRQWPENRRLMIVCHGHSVPAGYFKTPEVRTFDAYPLLLHRILAERFPHAVINVVTTAVGGEHSQSGSERFERDVLSLRPDVVTIDYGLNDRRLTLDVARASWTAMIERSLSCGAKVLLLTPTADLTADLNNPNDPLNRIATQIRELAAAYRVGLVDSLKGFVAAVSAGTPLAELMSQHNHPNRAGHEIVARLLAEWFPA